MSQPNIAEVGMTMRRRRQGHADAPVQRIGLRAALAGGTTSPHLTAAARAVLYVLLIGACNIAFIYLANAPQAWLVPYNAVLVGVLRQLEGIFDGMLQSNQSST